MIPSAFSSGIDPCATTTWRSSGESCAAGAYPAAFGFATGTVVSDGPDGRGPATAAVTAASIPAAAKLHTMRRSMGSPLAGVNEGADATERPQVRRPSFCYEFATAR